MKRMFTGLQRRVSTFPALSQENNNTSPSSSGNESPDEIIVREIKAFCEAGGGPNSVANDYLHLPAIVEAAESSATAAKEAAVRIRKYLSTPSRPQGASQYNAIMLIRILVENPGHTFTRNFDAKFVSTIKDLLREGRDMSAQHMLRETLNSFESQKSWDEDLSGLLAMWKKEKARAAKYAQPPTIYPPPAHQSAFTRPSRPPRQLPPPDELAARVSEARTSANLLIQLAQSTPAAEVQNNELMKEFSERCSEASRSIQAYMAVENPPPDEETMLTLIETNESLSVALSKYQRAILNARKVVGSANTNGNTTTTTSNSPSNGNGYNNNNNTHTATTNGDSQPTQPTRRVPTPPLIEEIPPLQPLRTTEEAPLSHSALPQRTALSSSPPPTIPPVQQQPAQRRYEYNADEFNVENPFADSTADDDLRHGHDRLSISSFEERVRRL